MRTAGEEFRFAPFEPHMANALIEVWRASYNRALAPYRMEPTRADQRRFLLENLVPTQTVTVATFAGEPAGFMAQQGEDVSQLYIGNDYQRMGLGSAFLDIARRESPSRLHLFTFQRNVGARRFYSHHGFVEIGRGHENMEGLPDIELEWLG